MVNRSAEPHGEEDYFALMHQLATLLQEWPDRPSLRTMATAADVSYGTIRNWLKGETFPQDVNKLVRTISRIQAAVHRSPTGARIIPEDLLNESRWRAAHRAELTRRAAVTGEEGRAASARSALARDPAPADPARYQAMAHLRTLLRAPYRHNEFAPRLAVEQRAIDMLLESEPPERGRIVALTGMSGSGKTALAHSIASRQEIRDRFPGGILWLELDRDSTPTFWRDFMLKALGESIPANDRAASALLQSRLERIRCLIVLDDAATAEQIESVNVIDPQSALLVTTQHEGLLAGMEICRVGKCGPETSLDILAMYSGRERLARTPEVDKVIDSCDGLALGLAICGALVRDGHQWDDIADSLDRAEFGQLHKKLPDYPNRSLHAALDVGVSSLSPDDQRLYETLAVFDRRGPVPVAVAHLLWSATGIDLREARRKIVYFARRSLLAYQADDGLFRLNDLLSQHVAARVRSELPDLHWQLAGAYLRRWGGAGLPDIGRGDDYAVLHLVRHLDLAGRQDLLHQVLAAERPTAAGTVENTWFAVHDRAGRSAEYLAELDLATKRAAAGTDGAVGAEERARYRALEMRYALARNSITGIAASVPSPLMPALVQGGVWSFENAWTYAATLPTPPARAAALAALARLPDELGSNRDLLLADARTAADAIEKPALRAWALARLIPCAPDEHRRPLFNAALRAADEACAANGTGGESARAWILVRLAPHVPDLVSDRSADIQAGMDGLELVEALTLVAEHIQDVGPELAAATRAVHRHAAAAKIVAAVPLVPESERAGLLAIASQDLTEVHRRSADRDEPLVAIPVPADPAVGPLVATLAGIRGRFKLKADVLVALLPLVPESHRPELIDAAVTAVRQAGPEIRRETLAAVLSVASETQRGQLLGELVNAGSHSWTLFEIARYLPPELLRVAVDRACALTTEFRREQAFEALAPWMAPELLRQALRALARLGLGSADDQAEALARLVGRIPPALQASVLPIIANVQASEERTALLATVALRLSTDLIPAAAAAIPMETKSDYRAAVLMQLAMRSHGAERSTLLKQAIEAACAAPERQPELLELLRLAAGPWQLANVMVLQNLLETTGRDAAVPNPAQFAQRLPPGALDRAAPIALAISDPCQRSHALAGLVACTSGARQRDLLKQALDAACARHRHVDGIRCGIASQLTEAARCVPETERERLADDYLASVTARDADSVKEPEPPWFDTDEDRRIRQMTCLLAYLPAGSRAQAADLALRELNRSWPEMQERDRGRSLIELAPLLAAEHSAELVRLAEDASYWDPVGPLIAVAEHAPEPARAAILDKIVADDSSHTRRRPSSMPARVVALLDEPRRLVVLTEALNRIDAIAEGKTKAEEIAALAPHLPPRLFEVAAAVADGIGEPAARAEARVAIARAGDSADPAHWRFWRAALADAIAVSRSAVLSAAVDACIAVGGEVADEMTEPTATQLAAAILATLRCWPGGSRSSKSGLGDLISAMIEDMTVDESDQEAWMSNYHHPSGSS